MALVPSLLGRLAVVFFVFGILVGQPVAPTQMTTTYTYTSTTFTSTTATITSYTTTTIPVSVVGTVTIDKVETQYDIWSQAALLLATLGSGAVGWFLGKFADSQKGDNLFVYGNTVYCRKHHVPVTVTQAGFYCPIHRKVIA